MAYTTDKTWVAGSVVLASDLQTYVSNNLKWLSTDKPLARATNTGVLSVASGGSTVTFDTVTFDNSSIRSGSTTRFTIPSGGAGKYLFGGYISFAGSATGVYRALTGRYNGSNVATQVTSSSATHNSQTNLSFMYSAAVAGYFELFASQDTGGALNSQTDHFGWLLWVGI
jgi:hypothetical protein